MTSLLFVLYKQNEIFPAFLTNFKNHQNHSVDDVILLALSHLDKNLVINFFQTGMLSSLGLCISICYWVLATEDHPHIHQLAWECLTHDCTKTSFKGLGELHQKVLAQIFLNFNRFTYPDVGCSL